MAAKAEANSEPHWDSAVTVKPVLAKTSIVEMLVGKEGRLANNMVLALLPKYPCSTVKAWNQAPKKKVKLKLNDDFNSSNKRSKPVENSMDVCSFVDLIKMRQKIDNELLHCMDFKRKPRTDSKGCVLKGKPKKDSDGKFFNCLTNEIDVNGINFSRLSDITKIKEQMEDESHGCKIKPKKENKCEFDDIESSQHDHAYFGPLNSENNESTKSEIDSVDSDIIAMWNNLNDKTKLETDDIPKAKTAERRSVLCLPAIPMNAQIVKEAAKLRCFVTEYQRRPVTCETNDNNNTNSTCYNAPFNSVNKMWSECDDDGRISMSDDNICSPCIDTIDFMTELNAAKNTIFEIPIRRRKSRNKYQVRKEKWILPRIVNQDPQDGAEAPVLQVHKSLRKTRRKRSFWRPQDTMSVSSKLSSVDADRRRHKTRSPFSNPVSCPHRWQCNPETYQFNGDVRNSTANTSISFPQREASQNLGLRHIRRYKMRLEGKKRSHDMNVDVEDSSDEKPIQQDEDHLPCVPLKTVNLIFDHNL